jgi:hypothetical protein
MKNIAKALLVGSALCATFSVSAISDSSTFPGTELTRSMKSAAIAPERICYVNTGNGTMHINTLYSDVAQSTNTKCKYQTLEKLTPTRLKEFDSLSGVFSDTKYFGERRAFIGQLLECYGALFEEVMQGIIGKCEKKNLTKLKTAAEWVEGNFHYLQDFKGVPFIDEYNQSAIMQVTLQSVKELRELSTYIKKHIETVPETKPVIVLTLVDDKNLKTLTKDDVAFLETYFEFSNPVDQELRSFLYASQKEMWQIRKRVKGGHIQIKTSATQKVMNEIESTCEDFEFDRILPKLPKYVLVAIISAIALKYANYLVDPVVNQATKPIQ